MMQMEIMGKEKMDRVAEDIWIHVLHQDRGCDDGDMIAPTLRFRFSLEILLCLFLSFSFSFSLSSTSASRTFLMEAAAWAILERGHLLQRISSYQGDS